MPGSRVILLVDDSVDDRILLRRAFARAGVINPIREVSSSAEAIAYFEGRGDFADRSRFPIPGILLLDLNMPGGSGFEVLEWLHNKFPVRGLLVIVLSRLDEIKSINRAYSLGANSFLSKPGNESELESLIATFRDYWLIKNKGPAIEGEGSPGRL